MYGINAGIDEEKWRAKTELIKCTHATRTKASERVALIDTYACFSAASRPKLNLFDRWESYECRTAYNQKQI